MLNPNYEDILSKFSRELFNSKWLEEVDLNQQFIKKHIESASFITKFNKMIDSEDFSCKRVLDICIDMLTELSKNSYPSDWLYYIYQFVLNKSFPDAVSEKLDKSLDKACYVYLKALRFFSQFNKDGSWQSKYPLSFLTSKEIEELEYPAEYKTFLQAFYGDYIYELMKLAQEVMGFSTLDHVLGVHFLALFIARQLKAKNLPVDLGRISGAAAGHDIGKFGCKGSELKRVPYLHYYYTDQWFKKYNIDYIRHIAINHSTWDLELENLPLESLILIYSDFRVKNINDSGNTSMHIFSLDESFNVILKKLDNVDSAKERRYRRVFAKLKDFEDFMKNIGIVLEVENEEEVCQYIHNNEYVCENKISYSLLHGKEVIQNIKYLAINHNINLMYQLRDEYSLENILQSARSQRDWKVLREYIRVFEEYSTYLTPNQKLKTMNFLYEQLIHPEDDIRRHSAELIGTLIATFDEDYRKELPLNVEKSSQDKTSIELFDEYLRLFLYPKHSIIPNHRAWIGYSTSIMVSSLFAHAQSKLYGDYINVLIKYYENAIFKNPKTQLYLIKIAECIPVSYNESKLYPIFDFILKMMRKHNDPLRLSAIEAAISFATCISKDSDLYKSLMTFLENRSLKSCLPAENYIKYELAQKIDLDKPYIEKLYSYLIEDREKISDLYLANLKTATNWVIKKINIEVLLHNTLKNENTDMLHAAMHFCNILKVSAIENVRSYAGESILKIMPKLPVEQRNDVAVELIRALEIEGNKFTEYIPFYLGRLVLWLKPIELDELIDDLYEKIKQANPQVKSLLLKTVSIAISWYFQYPDRFEESSEKYLSRLVKMLGIILNGLGDYNPLIRQVAFSVFGKEVFGSKHLSLEQKNQIFKLTAKKILTLMTDNKREVLLLLANSAGLNHIYRFISDYIFLNGDIDLNLPEKVAFFPGTFDPFSLSHKEIVKIIRDMGFEVYLAVDEFSWSKRTLPNLLRRKIITMSTADELNVYLYPENIPVNIANPADLNKLKNTFPNSKVYIVAGSDVLLNASCYYASSGKDSIYSFPHIIFERGNEHNINSERLNNIIKNIKNDVIRLSLPKKFMNISSSQIRSYIDENRDISSLVDPLAQQYIYEYGFYRREPQDKAMLQTRLSLDIEEIKIFSTAIIDETLEFLGKKYDNAAKKFYELFQKPSARLILARDANDGRKLLGFSAFHWIRSGNMYKEMSDYSICQYVRENSTGRIIMIDGIFVESGNKNKNLEQILLTETLSLCLSKDYECAIYWNMLKPSNSQSIYEILNLQGFVKLPVGPEDNPIFMVNMANPCTLNLDVESVIKEPFRGSAKVKQAILQSRKKLQEALTKLYPGELILSFDIDIQHELMIKKICAENGVPTFITEPRKLGPAMCVPYGNILDRYVIPNTVTKALHTEKFFSPDMKSFRIGPYPHYLDLEIQVKAISSFNRPVILVDDLLDKSHRLKAIDPLFKSEKIEVQKIIVGILTGRGKEIMDMQNRQVDSVYFLPRLKAWFNENSMYPFIGGDSLWRGVYPERNLLPSVNMILPYTYPVFIKNASMDSVYNLSKVSVENAVDILTALEAEYHMMNGRNLTLSSLGEVFLSPRCPDRGRDIDYNLNLNPSQFLENDLELLHRLYDAIN